MKKLFAIALVTLTILLMVVPVAAEPGSFVSSPSGKAAPELVEVTCASEDCTAMLSICAYSDRDTLDAAAQAQLEAAYASITGTTDLGTLNEGIKALAEQIQITSDKLAVSDLFDISYTNCDSHDEHGEFTITLNPSMLENYACLLRYNGSSWELVEFSEVSEDGEHLTFVTADLSPFAIVVHDGTAVIPTDESGAGKVAVIVGASVGGTALTGSGIFVLLYYLRRKKRE